MERVVITGMGAVTPLGLDLETTWEALLRGESGAGPITLFDATAFKTRFACEVKGWDPLKFIEKKKLKEMDRFIEFALGAAKMALLDSGLELTDELKDETGCFIGVGLGGLYELEKIKGTLMTKGPDKVSPYSIPAIIANLAAGQVSIAHGLRGPSYAATSACASGAHSIGEAAEWIRRGRARVMVTGGAEATVSEVGIGGFQAMFALSRRNDDPKTASRPFDKGRDGFVCGEGAGVLVLEALSHAKARGARIYGELLGYGAASDAYHLVQPAPEGEGAQRAMKMAIKDAQISAAEIGYVNAHGTSTPVGDKNECIAIAKVFGTHATDRTLPVSSTKSMTGHLLGAAGAIEAIFATLAVARGAVPPTINVFDQDPDCALDVVSDGARQKDIRYAMSNAFGFGGTNATLIVGRFDGLARRFRLLQAPLRCPFCSFQEDKVMDSRASGSGEVIRRRRECAGCERRYTTYERVEEVLPMVVKKDGRRELFDRQKLLAGLRVACSKRPVSVEALDALAEGVERELTDTSEGREVASSVLGERVMARLRELDEVAYVRFASVYRQFRDIDEFLLELGKLVKGKQAG